ncbi:MAG: Holliday junction resolvase RuvX [Hyphomicrobiales bacterium]|nr:MAG: Holliday junction resolvase RuvX [Hyphomicrobiales bacterium]
MPVVELDEFASSSRSKRLIGLDLGSKTIGIALSDAGQMIATPMETIRRTKFAKDALRLQEICTEHDIGGIVLGMPFNMDGSEGPRVQSTRAFVRNLEQKLDLPYLFWDERLTTVAAERAMLEADLSRKKRAARIDATAAGLILQGVLDRMRSL